MTVIDALARPRVVLLLRPEVDRASPFECRGLVFGIRARLPLAQVAAHDVTGRGSTSTSPADAVLAAADVRLVKADAATAVTLPPPGVAPRGLLCTSALPADLRRRRLALLRRLDWLPAGPYALAAELSAEVRAASSRLREVRTDLEVVELAALQDKVGVDEIAAVVASATIVLGGDALIAALAAGALVPIASAADGLIAALSDPAAEHPGQALLDVALDRLSETARARWEARGRPGDIAPALVSARTGAMRSRWQLEAMELETRLATTQERLRAAEAGLQSINHSRTWRWSRAVKDRLAAVRHSFKGRS